MSQASLPGLASELKIQIFKSMDTFSSVTILSSTSRTFHDVWKLNTKSISDAVLQRIIECPVEAKMLLDAEDSNPQCVPDRDTSDEEYNSYQSAINRTHRAFFNAHEASGYFRSFDYVALIFTLDRRLSSTERTHFIKAYFRARILARLSHQGIPEPFVASWNMLDFQRVREVLRFLALVAINYENTLRRIQLLDQDFLSFAPSNYLSEPPGILGCYFIAYEHFAKTTPKGPHLAELLPLLPEGALQRGMDPNIAQRRPETFSDLAFRSLV